MTGRACIGSGGRNTTQLSAQALTSCCDYCGSCKGGSTYLVWYYLTAVGIVCLTNIVCLLIMIIR